MDLSIPFVVDNAVLGFSSSESEFSESDEDWEELILEDNSLGKKGLWGFSEMGVLVNGFVDSCCTVSGGEVFR